MKKVLISNKSFLNHVTIRCLVIIGILLSSDFQPDASAQENSIKLRILYTSDEEGALLPSECKDSGGAAGIIQLWEEQEGCSAGNCLIISGGDIFTSDPIGSLFHGDTIINAMNTMKYDVLVLDNHELDFGVANIKQLQEQADFEFVSANYAAKDGRQAFSVPAVIKERRGVRIGIVGVSSGPEVLNRFSLNEIDENKARDYARAVQSGLDHLEQQGGADIYILVYHTEKAEDIPQNLLDKFDLHLKQVGSEGWNIYQRIELEIDRDSKKLVAAPVITVIPNPYTFKGMTSEAIVDVFEQDYPNINVREVILSIRAAYDRLREEDKRYAIEVLHNEQFADGKPVFDFPNNIPGEVFASELALAWYEKFPGADISVSGGGFRTCLSRGPIYISDIRGGLPFKDPLVMFPTTKNEFLNQYYDENHSYQGITPDSDTFVNRSGANEEWHNTHTYQVITSDYQATNSKFGYGLSENDIEIVADHWQKPTTEWFIENRDNISERLFNEQLNAWDAFWQRIQSEIVAWWEKQQTGLRNWWEEVQNDVAGWWEGAQNDIINWWDKTQHDVERWIEQQLAELEQEITQWLQDQLCAGAFLPGIPLGLLWIVSKRRQLPKNE